MAKQFDNDQVAVLQQIIREHERGLSNPSEMFGDYQKPLTYRELAAVRRILVIQTTSEAAERAVKYANDYAGALLDTFLLPPPPPKTSALLSDAANLINETVQAIGAITFTDQTTLMGKNWQQLVRQLRDRARSFKAVGK